ncbi:MAG: imidazolonepropionase [Bacteroidales bacterium]|jgi:imidazolonepropionase|nr:imidazolonepropionase [Bacteroidales bacterium]
MGLLIRNIKGLVQTEDNPKIRVCGKEMAVLNAISDAYLFLENGLISDFGYMRDLKKAAIKQLRIKDDIDASGKFIFPSFCDSHTHLVYAGSRETEFKDKVKGLSYKEIAKRGGGILNSAKKLHETSEDELFEQSMVRIDEIISLGTGAVEIKSGYGLNLNDELKMLRVIKRIKESAPLEVKATFLGAHAVPEEFRNKRGKYVDLVINEMIPAVAAEQLADFIDVFCDRGFFTPEDTERILMAGLKYDLIPKIHANELDFSGGVQAGVKYNALSVDHLEMTGDSEIKTLKETGTMPTLLPGSAFFLGLPDPPARKMIDAGLPVALASDYNPGSSPSGNMKLVMSLACIKLKMLPEEAINAVTINSAYAMGLSDTHGSIAMGKVANIFITKEIPSYEFMPYAFGSDLIDTVILKGKVI